MLGMANLKFEIDVDDLVKEFGDLKAEAEQVIVESVKAAALMTYGKVNELAAEKLHSTLKPYQEALSYEEVSPGFWVVTLAESAMWIEEGRKSGPMFDDLLRNGAKIGKDGQRYKSIPFEHSKNPTEQTVKAKEITSMIRTELKARGIPYKKIETDASGSPRLGKIHSFSVPGSPKPSLKAKYGALEGINVYQRKVGNKIKRDVMTFRIISDKQKTDGSGRWEHPGKPAINLMDTAYDWIVNEFETKILPEALAKFAKSTDTSY